MMLMSNRLAGADMVGRIECEHNIYFVHNVDFIKFLGHENTNEHFLINQSLFTTIIQLLP